MYKVKHNLFPIFMKLIFPISNNPYNVRKYQDFKNHNIKTFPPTKHFHRRNISTDETFQPTKFSPIRCMIYMMCMMYISYFFSYFLVVFLLLFFICLFVYLFYLFIFIFFYLFIFFLFFFFIIFYFIFIIYIYLFILKINNHLNYAFRLKVIRLITISPFATLHYNEVTKKLHCYISFHL